MSDLHSMAAKKLRNLAKKTFMTANTRQQFYNIADLMDKELTDAVSPFKSYPVAVCSSLITFIQSYYENGGGISEYTLNQILMYCSQIETNYQKMREHEKQMYAEVLDLEQTVYSLKETNNGR